MTWSREPQILKAQRTGTKWHKHIQVALKQWHVAASFACYLPYWEDLNRTVCHGLVDAGQHTIYLWLALTTNRTHTTHEHQVTDRDCFVPFSPISHCLVKEQHSWCFDIFFPNQLSLLPFAGCISTSESDSLFLSGCLRAAKPRDLQTYMKAARRSNHRPCIPHDQANQFWKHNNTISVPCRYLRVWGCPLPLPILLCFEIRMKWVFRCYVPLKKLLWDLNLQSREES